MQVPLGLGLPEKLTAEEEADRVVDSLVQEERLALVVFDNADDWEVIRDPVHRLSKHHLLITTRDPDLAGGAVDLRTRTLGILDPEPALELLLSCCGGEARPRPGEGTAEHRAAVSIAGRLGRLPLALEIASKYLGAYPDEISFASYDLSLIREGLTRTIDEAEKAGIRFTHTNHSASIRATFRISWERLQSEPEARGLVSRAAYFAPESIRPDLLAGAAGLSMEPQGPGRPSPFGMALRSARRAGLLEEGEKGRIVCHRLVGDFAREILAGEEKLSACRDAANSLRSLVNRPDHELVMALREVAAEMAHLRGALEFLGGLGEEALWAGLAHDPAR